MYYNISVETMLVQPPVTSHYFPNIESISLSSIHRVQCRLNVNTVIVISSDKLTQVFSVIEVGTISTGLEYCSLLGNLAEQRCVAVWIHLLLSLLHVEHGIRCDKYSWIQRKMCILDKYLSVALIVGHSHSQFFLYPMCSLTFVVLKCATKWIKSNRRYIWIKNIRESHQHLIGIIINSVRIVHDTHANRIRQMGWSPVFIRSVQAKIDNYNGDARLCLRSSTVGIKFQNAMFNDAQ